MREITGLHSDDFLLIFRQIDFFRPFLDQERRALAGRHTHLVAYDVGEYLIQEGSLDERSLFLLLSGGASVVKQGASIPLAAMAPGDFFGEVSFLTARPRTSNVIVHPPAALTDETPTVPNLFQLGLTATLHQATATVLRFDPELMSDLDVPLRIKIKDHVIQHLTQRVERMHRQVVEVTGHDPMLSVDPELERQLLDAQAPLAERERTKDCLIEQLAAFLDELNQSLVAC
ncbi:MAG: cyclic nucleotide-binding domain-containing protein [Magnetococcales bacterium]|nr:cyclic nucleotide-binding domain-containing protein [Magnetococcales bacterium]NGZ07416.1 cyclic nucleotide-binding domain-containing protein [Magnetococcales bacterium]